MWIVEMPNRKQLPKGYLTKYQQRDSANQEHAQFLKRQQASNKRIDYYADRRIDYIYQAKKALESTKENLVELSVIGKAEKSWI